MADEVITKQELEAAKIDVKHAGEAVNTKKVITPRYGAPFKSLPLVAAEAQAKADEVVAQGFYRGYTTEALLLAAKPAVAEMRARADDTRKIYRWNRTSAEGVTPITGTWVDTGLSDKDLAAADATTKANQAKTEAIAAAATDATTKANTAEANAKDYTDNATEPKLLSGSDIYYKAQENPSTLFQAIWQEYNKPVYHLGNSVVVDTTGAVLKTIEEELVFTIKLTAANQTFIYPTRANIIAGQNAVIDWGDGIVTEHTSYVMDHTYVGNIGDEFQIKVKGNPLHFDFGAGNGSRRTSRLMLKSIDKNTMPKTMPYFDLLGCTNLAYLCRGAYSSWIATPEFSPLYVTNSPNVVFHPKAFEGLESVTNILNMFVASGQTNNFDIPAGLLDPFVNVTSAVGLFRGLAKPLPDGVLDKLINLEDVSYMFHTSSITSIDNRIFKNQTKLKNVSQCFRLSLSLVADAYQLYTDMNQGNPTTVNGCFSNVNSMTNLTSVPTAWKTI